MNTTQFNQTILRNLSDVTYFWGRVRIEENKHIYLKKNACDYTSKEHEDRLSEYVKLPTSFPALEKAFNKEVEESKDRDLNTSSGLLPSLYRLVLQASTELSRERKEYPLAWSVLDPDKTGLLLDSYDPKHYLLDSGKVILVRSITGERERYAEEMTFQRFIFPKYGRIMIHQYVNYAGSILTYLHQGRDVSEIQSTEEKMRVVGLNKKKLHLIIHQESTKHNLELARQKIKIRQEIREIKGKPGSGWWPGQDKRMIELLEQKQKLTFLSDLRKTIGL